MLNRPGLFAAIMFVQFACAVFFVSDIVLSMLGVAVAPVPWRFRELMEIGAALGLLLGLGLGGMMLRRSLQRTRVVEQALRAASGAFMELVEDRFEAWGLTPAERDVALFAIKGCSLAEIARLRNTSEGTVKAQTNAIYRKAGVTGRSQLLSLFVEDLMGGPAGSDHPATSPDSAQN